MMQMLKVLLTSRNYYFQGFNTGKYCEVIVISSPYCENIVGSRTKK